MVHGRFCTPNRAVRRQNQCRSAQTAGYVNSSVTLAADLLLQKLSQVKFIFMGKLFSPSELSLPPIIQLEPENLKRMFVGLGSNGQVIGFGIITGITQGRIVVQTDLDSFDSIYLSNIKLSRDRAIDIRTV